MFELLPTINWKTDVSVIGAFFDFVTESAFIKYYANILHSLHWQNLSRHH